MRQKEDSTEIVVYAPPKLVGDFDKAVKKVGRHKNRSDAVCDLMRTFIKEASQ